MKSKVLIILSLVIVTIVTFSFKTKPSKPVAQGNSLSSEISTAAKLNHEPLGGMGSEDKF
ncbi:MAG: hypothetical protein K2U26_00805 [Cyclobacteriaceae bacterium]|nr:hypothetical protein [Cyclobacteriaceae bacterium]